MDNRSKHIQTEKPGFHDPEPISFALEIFAALAGAGGLVVQVAQMIREIRKDRTNILKELRVADRALNRMDEAYRSLISIYDEFEFLNAPFALGKNPLLADDQLRAELERLQSNIFYGGRDLQNALAELSGTLGHNDSGYAADLVDELDVIFREALGSKRLLEFMIQLGFMLQFVTEFIYRVAARYDFKPTSIRLSLLKDTISQLQSRKPKQ